MRQESYWSTVLVSLEDDYEYFPIPTVHIFRTYHPNSLLATGNPASPAKAGHLDSRL